MDEDLKLADLVRVLDEIFAEDCNARVEWADGEDDHHFRVDAMCPIGQLTKDALVIMMIHGWGFGVDDDNPSQPHMYFIG